MSQRWLRQTWLTLVLLVPTLGAAQSTVLLENNVARTVQLPAGSFTASVAFDLPAGVSKLRVQTSAPELGADVDLFLRYGEAFPTRTVFDRSPSFDAVSEQAHYRSISAENNELIVVAPQNVRPPRAGRWNLLLLNGGNAAATINLRATWSDEAPSAAPVEVRFDIPCPAGQSGCVCDLAPWNDATVGPNAPGNSGATLGAKRRQAAQRAAQLLTQQLRGEVPIVIQACWGDLGIGTTSVTVARAGPVDFYIDDPTLTLRSTSQGVPVWRNEQPAPFLADAGALTAAAPGSRLAGANRCRVRGGSCTNTPDIQIVFNSKIDSNEALGNTRFYYGLTAQTGFTQDIDFVSVALHELTHGAGFVSLVNTDPSDSDPIGSKPFGRDDSFSLRVGDVRTLPVRPLVALSNAERAALLISGSGLQWTDPRALDVTLGWNTTLGDMGVRLYAPPALESGSTLSHVDRNLYGAQLMSPTVNSSRSLGLAAPMLQSAGWAPEAQIFRRSPRIPTGLWFDPRRSGHGFDLQPATGPGDFDYLVGVFYTYSANRTPEYYIAYGPVIDGVFSPSGNGESSPANPDGDSLVRYLVRFGPNTIRNDSSSDGFMKLNFDRPERALACQDGRSLNSTHAALSMVINDAVSDWCLEPLIAEADRTSNDFSGLWFVPGDSGYGMTIATARQANGQTLMFGVLYFPDANEQPNWTFVQTSNFVSGATLPLFERRGYCRNCPTEVTTDQQTGSLSLTLTGTGADQRLNVGFDVAASRTPGTRLSRAGLVMQRLSTTPRVFAPRPAN